MFCLLSALKCFYFYLSDRANFNPRETKTTEVKMFNILTIDGFSSNLELNIFPAIPIEEKTTIVITINTTPKVTICAGILPFAVVTN